MSKNLAVALVVFTACADPTERAVVGPLRTTCGNFFGSVLCPTFVVGDGPSEAASFGFQGYTHRLGIETELELRREPPDPPFGERLIVVELIRETPVETAPFTLTFTDPPIGANWFQSGTLGGTQLLCEGTICDDIHDAEINSTQWSVTLEVAGEQLLRPLAVEIDL